MPDIVIVTSRRRRSHLIHELNRYIEDLSMFKPIVIFLGCFMTNATASLAHADNLSANSESGDAKNVVLVHGAFADGSGWRRVYENLTRRGYRVTIVQNPLTSLADDVHATERALNKQDGPTIQ